MLYFNIRRVMRSRGIGDPYKMLVKNGFVPATARKLVRNELRRVDLDVIEKLCLTLNCTPNDLLAWQPSQSHTNPESQALFKLKRTENADLAELLGSLPMEKLDEVAGMIQNLKEE